MTMANHLLDDFTIRDFIISGHLVLHPAFRPGFHEKVYADLEALYSTQGNPDNGIYEAVPRLHEVFEHAELNGAMQSLLGEDIVMHHHRHGHLSRPGDTPSWWHQDDVNQRDYQIRRLLVMYYPQDVSAEMAPTIIMPGTQYRNAPTSRMRSYGNLRDQKPLIVEAGTVVIAHYDIWHARAVNRGHCNRYMMKFIFDRSGEPAIPSWNHDPANEPEVRQSFIHTRLPFESQTDHYKQVTIRCKVWNWLKSGSPQPAPGAPEETVITYYR